jgi:hypothetical protein
MKPSVPARPFNQCRLLAYAAVGGHAGRDQPICLEGRLTAGLSA